MKILVIIPCYNEEESIVKTVESLKNKKIDYVVINDGSTDNSLKVLVENKINYITLDNNLGIGGVMQVGYKYAHRKGYDIAIQFDGDGQHDIRYVKDIVEPIIKDKADMVVGSRFVKDIDTFKSTRSRRVGIVIISFFIKLVTGKKIYDTTSGFRAINKDIIKDFANNYPVEFPEPITTTEIIKKGYRVIEKPVEMKERVGGVSSITSWKSFYYMINVHLSIIIIGLRRYKKCK